MDMTLIPSITRAQDEAAQLTTWRESAVLSSPQFSSVLAKAKIMTPEEATLFNRGELPKALAETITAALAALPLEAREQAIRKIEGSTEYPRMSPLTTIIGAAFGLDDAALDDLWRAGAAI